MLDYAATFHAEPLEQMGRGPDLDVQPGQANLGDRFWGRLPLVGNPLAERLIRPSRNRPVGV